MDPKSLGDSSHGASYGEGPRPLAGPPIPQGSRGLQLRAGRAFTEGSRLVPPQPWCSRPSSVNKILPSRAAPHAHMCWADTARFSVTVPKLRRTPPSELPAAPYLTPVDGG